MKGENLNKELILDFIYWLQYTKKVSALQDIANTIGYHRTSLSQVVNNYRTMPDHVAERMVKYYPKEYEEFVSNHNVKAVEECEKELISLKKHINELKEMVDEKNELINSYKDMLNISKGLIEQLKKI